MTMATRLSHYLNEHHIRFQTLSHEHSHSSLHSGIAAGVPLNHLAKGVVLEDHDGKHMMAILPANAKINLAILNDEMNATFHLVKEQEIYRMFNDCENGAIPPVGRAYHMAMVCDTSLTDLDHVYLEAGDHETLIMLDKTAFRRLMEHSKFIHFSSQVFH
ncbi:MULTISPECIES: aminoacyl-tRNA deacylase [Vibrio]|uniref:YbaK/aminoacyl-tRNA synthetase-associated domain-containing protein n=1 Tax=Vibrio proteolyticus NBRC 13287 TaxID=1219065 RepID=U3A0B9_VIBPR|nr:MULTISPECIES: YbaK/EbsC family protein [Vibrio]NAW60087.1 hypothetical protein [Vibrio sp. V36_P2S2PM302]NAX22140.1 hypothetical protein [Vibrio sp. V39_P1S14PM300]NAX25295.1 hypothetical protein [Vibrio sp. V38_P2S17PM301]NAX30046.1 hypothetical protein [Vibrio sp. V37_P2S8PM304]GAD67135.1 hypothetical protein VPR01S_06_01530 [Vibrio proteolyticus NBRC 13287]